MSSPLTSIIERIGRIGRKLDAISAEAQAIRIELNGLLGDVQAELQEHSKTLDRLDAALKESFDKVIK